MRFTLRRRLRRTAEFEAVRSCGVKKVCAFFILQVLIHADQSDSQPNRRLGVIASKRIGKAFQRNRAKRLLREIFRLNPDVLPKCCDVVLIARTPILETCFDVLQNEYRRLCQRLGKSI